MNPRFYALDLEFTQPLQSIIQIGVTAGNIKTGEIYLKTSSHVWSYDLPDDFITNLTGITTQMVQDAPPLPKAWGDIQRELTRLKVNVSPITWGSGDLWRLKRDLITHATMSHTDEPKMANTEYNLKSYYQFTRIAKLKSAKGGLVKSMEQEGLEFIGVPHNAEDDAYNTFLFAHRLLKEVK